MGGEPGGLPSMGSHRVGHDWSDLAAAAAATHSREVWACCCPTNGLRQESKMRIDNADVIAIE